MASLVMKCKLSLLLSFSDEIGFVADTLHNLLVFLFTDNLFLTLIAAFSDEMDFVTNNMTSNTFNDESVCRKNLKLLATKKFAAVD